MSSAIHKHQAQELTKLAIQIVRPLIPIIECDTYCIYCRHAKIDENGNINGIKLLKSKNKIIKNTLDHRNTFIDTSLCFCGFVKVLASLTDDDIKYLSTEVYKTNRYCKYVDLTVGQKLPHHIQRFITFFEFKDNHGYNDLAHYSHTIMYSILTKLYKGKYEYVVLEDVFDPITIEDPSINIDIKRFSKLNIDTICRNCIKINDLLNYYFNNVESDSIDRLVSRKRDVPPKEINIFNNQNSCNDTTEYNMRLVKDKFIKIDDSLSWSKQNINRILRKMCESNVEIDKLNTRVNQLSDMVATLCDKNKKQEDTINVLKELIVESQLELLNMKNSTMVEYNYENMKTERALLHKEFKQIYKIFKQLISRTYR